MTEVGEGARIPARASRLLVVGISNSPVRLAKCVPKLFVPSIPTEMLRFQVIKESAEVALSCVKTHSYDLWVTNKLARTCYGSQMP